MRMRVKVFGQRFCTFCGTNEMYYFHMNGKPIGACLRCDNTDWCDNETEADVKKRYGADLKPADIEYIDLVD